MIDSSERHTLRRERRFLMSLRVLLWIFFAAVRINIVASQVNTLDHKPQIVIVVPDNH